jgi:hypothetical protein
MGMKQRKFLEQKYRSLVNMKLTMEDRTIELLRKYLDGDFLILPMAPNKLSIQDIIDSETELGIKLPEEYRIHLLGNGDDILGSRGIYIEVVESIWERPKRLDVGPFWSFLYGFHTYTASKQSEDWMRIEIAGKEFFENTGLKVVPILRIIGDADLYCIDVNSQIVRYRHEENNIENVNMDFWQVLEYELQELLERKNRKIEQG